MSFDSIFRDFQGLTLDRIQRQALLYSFANTYSLSLLSSMGIGGKLSEETLNTIQESLTFDVSEEKEKSFELDYPFSPLQAVYAKGVPKVAQDIDSSSRDEKNFQWNPSSFKKNLLPQDQALLIANEVQFAKYLSHHSLDDHQKNATEKEKYIGQLLLHSAILQGEFCHHHLRDKQGFFVEKKDKSKNQEQLVLEVRDETVDLLDQIHMMFAYSQLYHVLCNPSLYPQYHDLGKGDSFRRLCEQILEVILRYQEQVVELKTRDFASATSLIIETLETLELQSIHREFITTLCAELSSRQLLEGQLSSGRFSLKSSSISTHGKAIKALVQGYQATGYDVFLETAKKIYYHLHSYWNNEISLYNYNRKKKIRISAKDVGSILSGLNYLLSVEKGIENIEILSKQLCSYFHSAINISGLQIASPMISESSGMMRKDQIDYLDPSIYCCEDNLCVFLKEFTIYPKKDKIYLDTSKFTANHALFTCLEMFSLSSSSPTSVFSVPSAQDEEDKVEILELIEE